MTLVEFLTAAFYATKRLPARVLNALDPYADQNQAIMLRTSVPSRDHLKGQPVRLTLNPWATKGPTEGIFNGQGERGLSILVEGGGRWSYFHYEVAEVLPAEPSPQVDYPLIRRLEQDLYGECFTLNGLDPREQERMRPGKVARMFEVEQMSDTANGA